MSDLYHAEVTVFLENDSDIGKDAASLGRSAHLSENFLVQLICEGHQGLKLYDESSRKAAACKIAEDALKSRYGSEVMTDVNFKEVSRYTGNIKMNLGDANFTAVVVASVWWI